MTRTRPTMDNYRKARAYEWLAEHGDSVYPVSDTEWVVFPPEGPERSDPVDLFEAVRLARELQGELDGP